MFRILVMRGLAATKTGNLGRGGDINEQPDGAARRRGCMVFKRHVERKNINFSFFCCALKVTKLTITNNSCGGRSSLPPASSALPAATSVFLNASTRVEAAHQNKTGSLIYLRHLTRITNDRAAAFFGLFVSLSKRPLWV